MWDRFTLYDKDGNKIMTRSMAQHIQWSIIEHGLLEGDNADCQYTVVSRISGYKLQVDKTTTMEQWRNYADECLMALD